MGRLSGADAEELALFGRRMEEAANRLESIRSEVAAAMGKALWDGEDAAYFRDQWQYRLSAMLQGAVVLTRNASAVAIRNAEQQRTTSATDTGPVGPGGMGFSGGGSGRGPHGDPGAVGPWDPLAVPGNIIGIIGGAGTVLTGFRLTIDKVGDASWLARAGNGSVLRVAESVAGNPWFERAEAFGKFAGYAGTAIDGFRLGAAIAGGDGDQIKARSVDAGVGLVFTIATGAAVACPPALIALGVVQIGYTFVPDGWKVAAVDGVAEAGQNVWNAAVATTGAVADAAGATVNAVQDAAGAAANAVQDAASGAANAVQDVGNAVSDIASGGFNGVRSLFGWR